ncbi:MAG TPA: hypothetical protein VFI47_25325 [Acidimicrobiales bacterium]|nr:hypothetical protein [Acidimicrobiales bacterium]
MTVAHVRAAAHIHSDWSDDGSWTLPDLAAAFAGKGYDLLLMSEHSRGLTADVWQAFRASCAEASSPDLLVVPGLEYNDPDNVVHMLVWGDVPFYGETPDIGAMLPAVVADGGVAVLAHPWRRQAFERVGDDWYAHLTAVELWNRKYDGWAPNRSAAELAGAHGLPAFAGLDFHRSRQFFPLAVDVEVPAPVADGLTPEAVVEALRSRRFVSRYRGRPAGELVDGLAGQAAVGAEAVRKVLARGARALGR